MGPISSTKLTKQHLSLSLERIACYARTYSDHIRTLALKDSIRKLIQSSPLGVGSSPEVTQETLEVAVWLVRGVSERWRIDHVMAVGIETSQSLVFFDLHGRHCYLSYSACATISCHKGL